LVPGGFTEHPLFGWKKFAGKAMVKS
jgi:hypothetical protein